MYLLYLDESGNPDDVQDRHFVLGGAAVFERVTYYLSQSFDSVQTTHFPGLPPIAFHATDIRSGNGFWRNIDPAKRRAVLEDLCRAVATANHPGVFLFASVIEKTSSLYGEAAVKRATEEICVSFDRFLFGNTSNSTTLNVASSFFRRVSITSEIACGLKISENLERRSGRLTTFRTFRTLRCRAKRDSSRLQI